MCGFSSTAFRPGKQKGIPLSSLRQSIGNNSWIELAARWILGFTFIYASFHKIISPADFAKIVYGYGLFPEIFINLIAIILPFLELIAGLALIIGIYPRSAAVIINALLLAFIAVLAINLIRGHEFLSILFSVCRLFFLKAIAEAALAVTFHGLSIKFLSAKS
jgi:uncharacterized membrane protein YphA (DoxX/SURF4 family)